MSPVSTRPPRVPLLPALDLRALSWSIILLSMCRIIRESLETRGENFKIETKVLTRVCVSEGCT